jgi:hypothetical protein
VRRFELAGIREKNAKTRGIWGGALQRRLQHCGACIDSIHVNARTGAQKLGSEAAIAVAEDKRVLWVARFE